MDLPAPFDWLEGVFDASGGAVGGAAQAAYGVAEGMAKGVGDFLEALLWG